MVRQHKFKRVFMSGTKNNKPPMTLRYCLTCKSNTFFKYNYKIGHSECVKCGHRFASRFNEKEEFIKNLISYIEYRIDHLRKNKTQLSYDDKWKIKVRIYELKKIRDYIEPNANKNL